MEKDRRILKTRAAIQQAFTSMLLEKGFDLITVKELAERADISRKTFYLHYADKVDLLNELVEQQLSELTVLCEVKKEKGFIEGTVLWFHYFEQDPAFFRALFAAENAVSFRSRLLVLMEEQLDQKLTQLAPHKNTLILRKFMAMAVLGMLEAYVNESFVSERNEIAEEVGRLLQQLIASA